MKRAWLTVAAVALVAVPPVAYSAASAALPEPATTLTTGLPDRLDGPWWWTPTVEQAPPGRTGVVVGGSTLGLRNPVTGEGTVDLVAGGRHTLLPFEFDGYQVPGNGLLLSPDGSHVAYSSDDSDELAVLDLSSGKVRRVEAAPAEHTPLAWGVAALVFRLRFG
ncbi:hypothetical protein [Actinoplanes solisilvae]|uniref:hypothetical protein n=1 Tax=Actinoplanes solisilvae TaxID=2486853 RepID=UPI000FDC9B06|nr:hypothetical protein [Actinoplanes solisilvae]